MWLGPYINKYNFFIPLFNLIKFLILKRNFFNFLYFYLNNYVFKYKFLNCFIIKCKDSLIKITLTIYNPNIFVYFKLLIFNFILKFYLFTYKKFKFDGKGYYLYKNKRNVLGLQFNYSHKVNIFSLKIYIRNFSKRSWIFFGMNSKDLIYLANYIKMFRKINIFTLKGIRFSNQIILYKKRKS